MMYAYSVEHPTIDEQHKRLSLIIMGQRDLIVLKVRWEIDY